MGHDLNNFTKSAVYKNLIILVFIIYQNRFAKPKTYGDFSLNLSKIFNQIKQNV